MSSTTDENDSGSTRSKLEAPLQVCEAILEVLGLLFHDNAPEVLEDHTIRFALFSSIGRGLTGDAVFDEAIREKWPRL